ncbi:hypothetical protein ACP70R_007063 [Stipagrostis hirtigluma subsp. patula]
MATTGDRGDDADPQQCDLFRCFCCWRQLCSPRIPRVAPGRDYECMPAGADDRPLWSVLVGCTSPGVPSHNLRLHRFRVAGSGRVAGRSDDLLEPFSGVSPEDVYIDDGEESPLFLHRPSNTEFHYAKAALGPDGRHLHITCTQWPVRSSASPPSGQAIPPAAAFPPKVVSLQLGENKRLRPLPPLPFHRGSYHAVSVHGELWVPAIVLSERGSGSGSGEVARRLSVYRLVRQRSWLEVDSVDFPYKHSFKSVQELPYGGGLLQGYAVIRDRFILLSFLNSSFFCFDCAAGTLTRVATDAKSNTHQYIPIFGRAVQFPISSGTAAHAVTGGGGDAVCFIRDDKLFVYMYSPEEGKPIAAPIEVDTLWPYDEGGVGFVVHLGGGILCAVWINMKRPCGCTTRHALITTLRVRGIVDETGHIVPDGVEILHSTCRRIDMLRSEAAGYGCDDDFCFLQEYPDHAPPRHSVTEGFNFPQVEKLPVMGDCCREFLSRKPERVTDVIELEDCKMAIKSDLYFICQVDQRSLVYQISISDGKLTCQEKGLEALLCLDTERPGHVRISEPPAWYFVHDGSMLDVIPSRPGCDHYVVDIKRKSYKLHKSKRSKLFFSAVFRVGQFVVSLCDTLQDVYILNRNNFQWRRQKITSRSVDLSRKAKISGFVDLGDDVFMVSDAKTAECLLFDLKRGEWFAVEPPAKDYLGRYIVELLYGRCLFVKGFIYSCSDDGLIAFELIHDNTCYRLGTPILLDFSWKRICGLRCFISFDSICKGQVLDSIAFGVVHGYFMAEHSTSSHTLASMTVQVKLEETARGTKRPTEVGHVDIALSSINEKGNILTNYAFAL